MAWRFRNARFWGCNNSSHMWTRSIPDAPPPSCGPAMGHAGHTHEPSYMGGIWPVWAGAKTPRQPGGARRPARGVVAVGGGSVVGVRVDISTRAYTRGAWCHPGGRGALAQGPGSTKPGRIGAVVFLFFSRGTIKRMIRDCLEGVYLLPPFLWRTMATLVSRIWLTGVKLRLAMAPRQTVPNRDGPSDIFPTWYYKLYDLYLTLRSPLHRKYLIKPAPIQP